jgi:predicted HTH domain antitoxin
MNSMAPEYSELPDSRDGLTRKERIILYCLNELQRERGDRNVPTFMLYGRVVEYVDISVEEMQSILQRMIT